MTVFVTDGEQRATLAVVRALGRAGICVIVGSSNSKSLAASSKYCSRSIVYPSPRHREEQFLQWLEKEMASGGYRVLLPMTDLTVQLTAKGRNHLLPYVSLPFPAEEPVQMVQDKRHVLGVADQLSIPIPDTFMLHPGEHLDDVAPRLRYPAVIKPRFSSYRSERGWHNGGVEYVCNPADLRRKYEAIHARIPFPLVQQRITGEGRGVFLLLWNGQLKAAFCHRRLREKPPWGGPSVYSESIPPDQPLIEKCVQLLRALGWQGPAMVEFKIDQSDGQAKLMEVNGRFWGSLQLAIDAGINFPVLLYQLARGENPPSQFDYKAGARWRWLLGDFDHLLLELSRSHNGFSGHHASRLRACLRFLKLYEPGLRYDVCRREDPMPGWHELRAYMRGVPQSLRLAREGDGAN
jgi:predicted ATP-grasp superfamily ATP-dependent carboligase